VTLGTGILTTGGNGTSTSYAGVISGAGGGDEGRGGHAEVDWDEYIYGGDDD